ncbi:MAG TPA: GTPase [Candidatus Nanoarchaeia archaeon]|nr:GTPase [Candidatus Nanoarchaeia archaeon]
MPVNVSPDYAHAEKEYLSAITLDEKIERLEELISLAPGHKGAENLRAQLKNRLKRLKERLEKSKKTSKGTKVGIKKQDMQAVIIGFTNTGKSSLLSLLTSARPKISDTKFTTKEPAVGMMNYATVQIQLIEIPAFESGYYDKGLVNTADVLLILITDLDQLKKISSKLEKTKGKKIVVFNKSDLLNEQEKRKISSTLQSRKYNFIIISTNTQEGIKELKGKIFKGFGKIRIYTKEPGKEPDKTKPIILNPESTIKNAAEKILKGFSEKIKQTKIWGPSSKFPGQIVSFNHRLKDLDIVEFKTK